MTERFTVEFDGHRYFLVIDEVNERCLARLDTRVDALAWLEMYKMLLEENEQLKEQWKEKRHEDINELSVIAMKYKALEKENEQLKKAYAQLKHRHSLLHDVCIDAECDRDSYRKDIASLEKENEQLKQRINVLDDQITAQGIVIESYQNRNQKLFDEKEHIKHTIKTMMENERTELGKSVLKQLYEAIQ